MTKLLFIQPALLLTFVQIGIVLSTFALTQLFSAWQGLEDYERRFSDGTLSATRSEVTLYQQRRQFARFLAAIGGAAVGYFLAVPMLLVLMTFQNATPPTPPSLLYVLLSNSAFILTLIPTLYISTFFVYYRLRRYRFH